MTFPPRLVWMLHLVVAMVATTGIARAGASDGGGANPSVEVATRGSAASLRTAVVGGPMIRLWSPRAASTRAAWQRSSRRTSRSAASQLTDVQRAPGTASLVRRAHDRAAWHTRHRDRVYRHVQLRVAAPRAPPHGF